MIWTWVRFPYPPHNQQLNSNIMSEKESELPEITKGRMINKSNLKLYDIFLNNSGYLSMVYAISQNKLHIINYNGSIYTVNKNDGMTKYARTNSAITPTLFIYSYPKGEYYRFNDINKTLFLNIKNNIIFNSTINKKLLILK